MNQAAGGAERAARRAERCRLCMRGNSARVPHISRPDQWYLKARHVLQSQNTRRASERASSASRGNTSRSLIQSGLRRSLFTTCELSVETAAAQMYSERRQKQLVRPSTRWNRSLALGKAARTAKVAPSNPSREGFVKLGGSQQPSLAFTHSLLLVDKHGTALTSAFLQIPHHSRNKC